MSCAETLRTHAYVDGELDRAVAEDVERHLESCPECRDICTSSLRLRGALRSEAASYDAPAALRARIGRKLDEIAQESVPQPRLQPSIWRSFWTGAAGGALVTGLAAALIVFAVLPPTAQTLSGAVTDAHTRALMSGRAIDIVSSNHHTVKPWFAGRVEISPPVKDFAQKGFVLAGGRVDRIAGQRAAVLVYRHGKHEIDLFVWADRGSKLPQSGMSHGYRSMFWRRADLDFAAVSDMQSSELEKFVALIESEPE